MTDSKVTPIDRGKSAAKKAADDAREVVGHTLDGAKEKLEDMGDRLGEASHEARRIAEEQAEHVKENYGKFQDGAVDVAEDVDSYVVSNPGRAVLLAVAVGFVIGLLLRDPDTD